MNSQDDNQSVATVLVEDYDEEDGASITYGTSCEEHKRPLKSYSWVGILIAFILILAMLIFALFLGVKGHKGGNMRMNLRDP